MDWGLKNALAMFNLFSEGISNNINYLICYLVKSLLQTVVANWHLV